MLARLHARTSAGRLIRLPLRLVPANTPVRVLSGPLVGARWIAGSAPHGAWIGTLERQKLRHLVARLRPGMTVWDVGANVGLYTLAAARAVMPGGRVSAFEPFPRNLDYLNRHLSMNRVANVQVVGAAAWDRDGTLAMAEGDSPSEFHADGGGTWRVHAVTLDGWRASSGSRFPDVVKVDVEGAEDSVLRGAADTFSRTRPLIYLALHGQSQREACARLLGAWDYRVVSLAPGRGLDESDEWVAEPR